MVLLNEITREALFHINTVLGKHSWENTHGNFWDILKINPTINYTVKS